MSRAPLRIVYITRDTALVRGATAEQMRAIGTDRRMWCDPISTWAVARCDVGQLLDWARMTGRRVQTTHAEIDR